jgi:hypothetical protein
MEQILPDAKANEIGQKMVPLLQAKKYDGAVMMGVEEIARAVSP